MIHQEGQTHSSAKEETSRVGIYIAVFYQLLTGYSKPSTPFRPTKTAQQLKPHLVDSSPEYVYIQI